MCRTSRSAFNERGEISLKETRIPTSCLLYERAEKNPHEKNKKISDFVEDVMHFSSHIHLHSLNLCDHKAKCNTVYVSLFLFIYLFIFVEVLQDFKWIWFVCTLYQLME